MKSNPTLLTIATIGFMVGGAQASTLIDSTTYNGHTYELWESPGISWQDARTEAGSSGGYLAAFTDLAETTAVYNDFIGTGFFTANDGQQYQAWLGGYTADLSFSTTDPNNWAWVSGDPWTGFDVSNFAGGEPNGDSSGLTINRFGTAQWNDEGGLVGGYIVEKSVPDAGLPIYMLGGSFVILGAFKTFARARR